MVIETENLLLYQCNPAILSHAIAGNQQLSKTLGVKVEDNCTEFGTMALQYAHDRLQENIDERGWWTYLPVHRKDNQLIGSCGYKGKPTPEGNVEIGYEIMHTYRNRGLATELAQALIDHAFQTAGVKSVTAHTLAEDNATTKVLQKCGFQKVEEINDPDDGLLWKWELKKTKV